MSENNGGPAFQSANDVRLGDSVTKGHFGMTLRDYFAAKAMQGMLADKDFDPSLEELAKTSYRVADAMLSERGKK